MTVPQASQAQLAPTANPGAMRSHVFTFIAASTAAAAPYASVHLDFPVWVMFVGWVGYSSRAGTWRNNLFNYGCLVMGAALGIGAALALVLLEPSTGAAALPIVVFLVAIVVVSMRVAPPIDNLTCYFLGLIAFFASDLPPTLSTLFSLSAAMAVGCVAASISTWLQSRI